MKILWHSVSPFCQSGYASVTREIVRRLIDLGHSIVIGTKHRQYGSFSWGGAEVVDGTNLPMMVEYSKQFDLVFTFWDVWRMECRFPREKWVAYTPISTQTISDMTTEVLKDAQTVVAMTKHGETEMRNAGLEPFYAPHGVDIGKFRIKPEGRAEFRKKLGISDDTFLIGSVGINYADDRKGFVPLILAFKQFHKDHPKSALYIHTYPLEGNVYPLAQIAHREGVQVAFPSQLGMYLNHFNEENLVDAYNAMDLFVLPTRGEGFGLPIVEAQACGTTVAVSDNTSGPELRKSGALIRCNERDKRWVDTGGWRYEPTSDAILDAIRSEYLCRLMSNREDNCREILAYDWDKVWNRYWIPLLYQLEGKK